ncbi:hypothetical protein [Pasteurella multocida]|uniref:hypothetical protein n=1 Tax=Pasteurella multocida TaxID=747 RepID=UPI000BBD01D8|nr:hypothetical protein [Pasteurella multocida]ATF73979.1 hypothetical protein CO688_00680 [Pasteurella multocida]ATN16380.1 hypothetical protein CRN72_00970 [Pasteurella multocida]MCL7818145.1 hypothetical protein [Pasteurella multocida]MDY0577873.1 hypothetical protein [Pasteurella multocida]MEB3458062.1 hypothetical protein [Pasteurella multocida]
MYQYYLAELGDNRQKLIRGNPADWLSFATYEPEKEDWDQKFGTFWADKILVSGFSNYEEISEKEAIIFMKAH